MNRWSLLGAWLSVLVLTTMVTWQIVNAADSRVSGETIAPLNVAAPALSGANTGSTTSAPATSSSTSSIGPISSSTSTTASSPTTSPASEPAWQTKTVKTAGGSIILRYRPGEVTYQSASPAPGFHVEVDKKGPPEVKVEFESESRKIEVEAHWSDGDLEINVSGDAEE